MQSPSSDLTPITSEQLMTVTGGYPDHDPSSPTSAAEIAGALGGALAKALGNGPGRPAPRRRMSPL